MSDPAEIFGEAAGNAMVKALESKPVENLLAPITNELGLTLGDIGSVVRFYVSQNLTKVFTKWAQKRQGRPVEVQDIPRMLPLLQCASLESDEELQDRWANLLESSVSIPDRVLPSFGVTLSQMTAEEARFLDKLWNKVIATNDTGLSSSSGGSIFDYKVMCEVFEPGLYHIVPALHLRNNPNNPLSAMQLKAIEKEEKLDLMIQDLTRLGILGTISELIPGKKKTVRIQQYAVELPTSDPELDESNYFTPYGRNFIHAVTLTH